MHTFCMKVWLVTKEICLANFSGQQFYLLSNSSSMKLAPYDYMGSKHVAMKSKWGKSAQHWEQDVLVIHKTNKEKSYDYWKQNENCFLSTWNEWTVEWWIVIRNKIRDEFAQTDHTKLWIFCEKPFIWMNNQKWKKNCKVGYDACKNSIWWMVYMNG